MIKGRKSANRLSQSPKNHKQSKALKPFNFGKSQPDKTNAVAFSSHLNKPQTPRKNRDEDQLISESNMKRGFNSTIKAKNINSMANAGRRSNSK